MTFVEIETFLSIRGVSILSERNEEPKREIVSNRYYALEMDENRPETRQKI